MHGTCDDYRKKYNLAHVFSITIKPIGNNTSTYCRVQNLVHGNEA